MTLKRLETGRAVVLRDNISAMKQQLPPSSSNVGGCSDLSGGGKGGCVMIRKSKSLMRQNTATGVPRHAKDRSITGLPLSGIASQPNELDTDEEIDLKSKSTINDEKQPSQMDTSDFLFS